MKLIHIVGKQNNGKTTLIVDVVKELAGRGLRIGTLKHSGHEHELDRPGKDSFLHREAGGNPAAVVTANMMAVFMPRDKTEDPVEKLVPLFADTDLVLVEGYVDGPGEKIEVWREAVGTDPMIFERDDIKAVVTDDDIKTDLPVWPRKDVSSITDNICALAGI